jgi:glutaminyl-tRNA synthetase
MARLRYGYVVKCTAFDLDDSGAVSAVHCEYFVDSKSGTPGADGYKVKGNLHWISVAEACPAEVRLYDRLFSVPSPGARREGDPEGVERDFRDDINPDSMRVIQAWLEPSLKAVEAEDCFQFERHGYFVADRVESQPGAPVFNRTVTLRDSWSVKGGARK